MDHARSGRDAAVQATNDDAQLSKLACVRLGYFNDDFVHLFVRRPARRAPLINRGYYSRYAALRTLLFQFLAAGADAPGGPPPKQVLSLGAGYDTAFFQMAKDGLASPGLTYVELDFPEVTRHKATAIARTPELLARLSPIADAGVDVDAEAGRVRSARYRLEPADLRQLDTVEAALQGAGLDPDLPTFVLAECVLVYMPPPASAAAVRWLGGRLRTAVFAAYEQVNPSDAFGRQMMVNLESRGVPLLGILPSLEAHVARFTGADWQRAEAKSMREIYARCIDPVDRRRVERLEIFDEFEEWDLIQDHYCIALAVNDASGLLADFGFPRWEPQPPPQFKAPAPG